MKTFSTKKSLLSILILLCFSLFFQKKSAAQGCFTSQFVTGYTLPSLSFDHAGIPGYTMIGQHDGRNTTINEFMTAFDLDIPAMGLTNYTGFCTEVGAVSTMNTVYSSYKVVELQFLAEEFAGVVGNPSVLIPAGGVGLQRAGIIRYLFDKHFVSTNAAEVSIQQAASFQMALWEITHDQYVATPHFSIKDASVDGLYYDYNANTTEGKEMIDSAELWLNDIENKTWDWSNYSSLKWHVVGLQSGNGVQDLVIAEPITQCVLPVKFSSFTAVTKDNNVMLNWITQNEINVNRFIIEKSVDGVNYTNTGIVFADAGAKNNYSFTDKINGNQPAVIYYRIRSVDMDGRFALSEVSIAKLNTPANSIVISSYPNPVVTSIHINNPAAWVNKKITYEFFNASGNNVKQIATAKGVQTETIDVSLLAAGFYIVKATCQGEMAQQKVIKN